MVRSIIHHKCPAHEMINNSWRYVINRDISCVNLYDVAVIIVDIINIKRTNFVAKLIIGNFKRFAQQYIFDYYKFRP